MSMTLRHKLVVGAVSVLIIAGVFTLYIQKETRATISGYQILSNNSIAAAGDDICVQTDTASQEVYFVGCGGFF